MISFKPITIDDREIIEPFFNKSIFRNCDFSFPNIFAWKGFYNTMFAVEDGYLYIRFHVATDPPGYLFPLGEGNLKLAIERIIEDANERQNAFRLSSVTPEMFDLIEKAMPGQFDYEKQRHWYEYIYSSGDLIHLVGKKYQAKRNHINKFKRTYEWEYLPITREIIPDCLKLYNRWYEESSSSGLIQSLIEERIGTQQVFDNYEKLGLTGGALRIDGEILAYSYGRPLTHDTFGVHAEKCLHTIHGGFAMINQQFAERNCSDYPYVNREEDLSVDSLRQAKMSYHPAFLLEKGKVQLK